MELDIPILKMFKVNRIFSFFLSMEYTFFLCGLERSMQLSWTSKNTVTDNKDPLIIRKEKSHFISNSLSKMYEYNI